MLSTAMRSKMPRAGRYQAGGVVSLHALVGSFPQRPGHARRYAVVLAGRRPCCGHAWPCSHRDQGSARPRRSHVIEGLAGSARAVKELRAGRDAVPGSDSALPRGVEPQIGLAPHARRRRQGSTMQPQSSERLRAPVSAPHRRARKPSRTSLPPDAITSLRWPPYQAILAQQPAHRGALRGKIQTLARLGTPQLASNSGSQSGCSHPDQREAIAADRTAHQNPLGPIAADTARPRASRSGPRARRQRKWPGCVL